LFKWEKINDNNNGVNRPDSSVKHWKIRNVNKPYTTPQHLGSGTYLTGHSGGHPPGQIASLFETIAADTLNQLVRSAKKEADRQFLGNQERWSSLNFLSDLTDIPKMIKSLEKYRYTDYAFGIRPFLEDCKRINDALNTTVDLLNARLADMKSKKNMEFHASRHSNLSGNTYMYSGEAGNCQIEYNMSVDVKIHGTGTVVIPDYGVSPNFGGDRAISRMMLDVQGFHPDAATVWEAVPFSWLVDWVLPVGNYLESMTGNWFQPAVSYRGTISSKIVVSYSVIDDNAVWWLNANRGRTSAEGIFTLYQRDPFAPTKDDYSTLQTPRLELPSLPVDRLAILADVFGLTRGRR